jgi:hypothetical protein
MRSTTVPASSASRQVVDENRYRAGMKVYVSGYQLPSRISHHHHHLHPISISPSILFNCVHLTHTVLLHHIHSFLFFSFLSARRHQKRLDSSTARRLHYFTAKTRQTSLSILRLHLPADLDSTIPKSRSTRRRRRSFSRRC